MSLIIRESLIAKAHCPIMRTVALGNNEPRFREIISPRKISNSEKIRTVRVSFDHELTQPRARSLTIRHLPGRYYLPKSRRGLIIGLIVATMSPKALIIEQ